jgi:hypothetical protein
MADTVKIPVVGPVKTQWVWIGGALVLGIVGYAYWTRSRATAPPAPLTEEEIPQDREPPPTIVGSQDFDFQGASAIINTNSEWTIAATQYLTDVGWDGILILTTLGKFLARRPLTEAEANLVQAAKGAVGEPPQGGPWPIIRATAPGPSTPPAAGTVVVWQGYELKTDRTWFSLAAQFSQSKAPNGIEKTRRLMMDKNPGITARVGKSPTARLRKGWKILIPKHKAASAA